MSSLTRRELLGGAVAASAVALHPSRRWPTRPLPSPSTKSSTAAIISLAPSRAGSPRSVQEAGRRWGLPNGYILGQEASAAFVGGLRYGEGKMYTRNAGDEKIFWQGPSVGFDAGADGDRTMMLVYNLPAVNAIFRRFGGIDGSAYFVGGFGFTALGRRQRDRRADPLRRRRPAWASISAISSSRLARPGTRSSRTAFGGRAAF